MQAALSLHSLFNLNGQLFLPPLAQTPSRPFILITLSLGRKNSKLEEPQYQNMEFSVEGLISLWSM